MIIDHSPLPQNEEIEKAMMENETQLTYFLQEDSR